MDPALGLGVSDQIRFWESPVWKPCGVILAHAESARDTAGLAPGNAVYHTSCKKCPWSGDMPPASEKRSSRLMCVFFLLISDYLR